MEGREGGREGGTDLRQLRCEGNCISFYSTACVNACVYECECTCTYMYYCCICMCMCTCVCVCIIYVCLT